MIEIVNGSKVYSDGGNKVTVLQPFDLSVNRGEFISVRGKSGSGKSTLLHVLGGMDRLTEGDYYFNGSKLRLDNDNTITAFRGKHFGFIFQSYHLIKEFTAIQNIEAPMAYRGISGKQRRERAMQLLTQVGLADKARSYPMQLSGGQQQRVAIARALANQPDVLFADEPTGNLDRENGDIVIELLSQLHKQGTTLILVTHDEELADMAERSIYLANGHIIA